MAYGLTFKSTEELAKRLSEILSVPPDKMLSAFDIVTKEQVKRIAKNEKGA